MNKNFKKQELILKDETLDHVITLAAAFGSTVKDHEKETDQDIISLSLPYEELDFITCALLNLATAMADNDNKITESTIENNFIHKAILFSICNHDFADYKKTLKSVVVMS